MKKPEEELPPVSRRLKKLRQSRKWTQKDVAGLLCVDRSTYSYYETGKTQPSLQTLMRLSGYYHVSLDYLAGKTSNPAEAPDRAR